MMKKFILALISMSLLLASGCAHIEEYDTEETADTEETTEVQTVTVDNPEYYTRFKNDGISINVYNWGEYIPDGSEEGVLNLNAEFTKLTGITVNYSTYATNEELYAKLKGGGSTYDIIIPSDYMISRMIKENMLEPLDKSNIPNFANIMDKFKSSEYDPGSKYSVPYTWGTVGIIYDTTVVDEEDIGWDILWDEDYSGRILMFDNPRDAFAIAENMLGYSLNTENSEELEKAAEKLKEQKKVVQAYVMDEIFDKMGAGEAIIAPYYAGDAVTLMDEYEDLGFAIPESGTNLFIDAVCIPKGCRNKEAAEMYINFLNEPDVAYAIADFIGYSTPNQKAYEMLDDEVKNDGISYLDDDYIEEKTTVFCNLSDEANQKMQTLWTDMKSSEEQTPNKVIVPAFMSVCVIASLIILIRRYIKKKKEIYLVCKFIVTFISGGIAAGLPYVFSFMMNLLYVPAIKPNQLARHNFVNQLNNMSDWYYEKPFLYFGVYLLIIMLCGGVFATLSLCVSFAAKNSLFVMFFPFLFNISFDYVAMELKIEKYVPSNIMNPMMTEYIKGRSMFSVFVEIFAAILLCFGFFVVLNKKRERIV